MYTISAGGYYTNHPAPFKMYRPNGIPHYLLLFFRTKASLQIEEISYDVFPNQVLIVDKNTPYQYSVSDTPYMDDWLHFDCSKKDFPFLPNIINKPITLSNATRIATYIHQILWEANYADEEYKNKILLEGNTASEPRNNNVDMLMHVLMNHLEDAVRFSKKGVSYSPYYGKMQDLRLRLQANPNTNMSLDEIAESMSISSSYFQHLYSQYFGISFRNDIISMRIEYAKELLVGTNESIENTAYLCGYNNEVHFYRQFRKFVGMTPTQYRNTTIQ